MSDDASNLTFIISTPIRDLGEYRALAEQAVRLKRFGRVDVNISALAAKSLHEFPPGGSPWHEYAGNNPTPTKFFPDPMVAPFLPAAFVKRNRQLLLAKVDILRELGLGAAFWSYEPNFLPEAFFEKYPHLRGPRSDHPRRSMREEFAPCVDRRETLDLVAWQMTELAGNVPELGTFYFKTNDAGPALCWSHWGYNGANGPQHCRGRTMGQRVRGLVDAITAGARAGGIEELQILMTGNFSDAEKESIESNLPRNCSLRGGSRAGSLTISSSADSCYPVRGVLDPLAILLNLQPIARSTSGDVPRSIVIDLRSSYDRGHEQLETATKIFETVEGFLEDPVSGLIPVLQRLRYLCQRWVGPDHAEALFDAFVALHEAFKYKRAAIPKVSAIYGGVSMRYITRPLVAAPADLSPQEESYFLPHVFNVSREQAREDYIDQHGTRLTAFLAPDPAEGRIYAIDRFGDQLAGVCRQLEALPETPQTSYFRRMTLPLRMYASILRSCGNFFAFQYLRDRNPALLNGTASAIGRVPDWHGGADYQALNERVREELDNAQDLLDLLTDPYATDYIILAKSPADEDTFLLGPDLPDQIRRKRQIMRAHWRQLQDRLPSPNR